MKDTYLLVGLLVLYAGISYGSSLDDDEYSGWYGDWSDSDASGSGDYPTDLSRCREESIAAAQESRLNKNDFDGYIPVCDSNGHYEATQCSYSQRRNECWCVTYGGVEIQGTRKDMSSSSQVLCVGIDRTSSSLGRIVEDPIAPETGTGTETEIVFVDPEESEEEGGAGETSHSGSDDIFREENAQPATEFLKQPLILASGIALVVVFLLCAVLLVMFVVYRMRKKDEGSYSLDEPKRTPSHPYQRAPTKEYFA